MAAVEIQIDETLVEQLHMSFIDGPITNDTDRRYFFEHVVGAIGKLSISIFADEHPPPHFRVRYQGESASFSIVDGARLRGNRGLEEYDRNIRKWWKENRQRLIEKWNATRPSDCPVGPVKL